MRAVRHALVTGGSSGIGRALAGALVAQGADVTLIARSQVGLSQTVEELDRALQTGQRLLALSADVSDRTAIERAIGTSLHSMGAPDLVACCAGMCHPGRIGELDVEVFERTNAVNYLGTVYTVLACLPAMQRAGGGHLVLMSSGAGLVGITGYAPYSPTKFAVRGLGEVLRADLQPYGIGVSVVYPPDTDTAQLHYERRFKPPETSAITAGARVLSAQQVAHTILRGVARQRFAITPGWEMRLLEPLASVLKPVLFRYFDRLANAARSKAAQP